MQVVDERVVLDREALVVLRDRLAVRRLPPDLGRGWERGVPVGWLDELLTDWRRFDTDALQQQFDALTHLRAEVDGQSLHVVHERGRGAGAVPLLLVHGWPGSFLEHLPVLPLLTGAAEISGDGGRGPGGAAFDVVVPSLPGFGFSGAPPDRGLTAREVAGMLHRLMTEGLGHERYVAHGSDLGVGVTSWLARDHPDAVAGIHLATPGLAPAAEPRTPAERAHGAEVAAWTGEEGGYAHQHATKPTTLAAGLTDSPTGLAAWVGEKVSAWSSTRPDGSPAFDRDLLLATLTVYWVTGTIATSLLPYWAYRHSSGAALPIDDPCSVPTAVSNFGGERVPLPKPPRALAERYYRLAAWTDHGVGGHFPSVAEPALLASTLRRTLHPRG